MAVELNKSSEALAGAAQSPAAGLQAAAFAARRQTRNRLLLVAPALLIIGLIGIMPLSIVVVYSFLEPGPYAGVTWQPSFGAWVNVLFERDLFEDTLQPNYAHISIFSRSVGLALATTVLTLIFGFPTAYFIATRPAKQRNLWLFLISLPFWSNLLVRTFAMLTRWHKGSIRKIAGCGG